MVGNKLWIILFVCDQIYYEHSPITYIQIISPLFIHPTHNKRVVNPRQVILATTKQIEVKKNNKLERNTNYDEEQALNSVNLVPDQYTQ